MHLEQSLLEPELTLPKVALLASLCLSALEEVKIFAQDVVNEMSSPALHGE